MQLSLSEAIKIPVQTVLTNVDIENTDHFSHTMAKKLARKHFEQQGFTVLDGDNFENNMLLHKNEGVERRNLDDYTKVKVGRAKLSEDARIYSEMILDAVPKNVVDLLLHLCRMCSYTGGPGFPDFVLIKDKGWRLCCVLFDELERSQKLFLLLSTLCDIGVDICEVRNKESKHIFFLLPSSVISSVLNDSRSVADIDGTEMHIEDLRNRLGNTSMEDAAQTEDDITYLLAEKEAKPFHVLRKWQSEEMMDSQDVSKNMSFVDALCSDTVAVFREFERLLLLDAEYTALAKTKTEDAMRQKARMMQRKFGLGEERAKALLRFMEAR